jgi:hypothetical protein
LNVNDMYSVTNTKCQSLLKELGTITFTMLQIFSLTMILHPKFNRP